MRLGRVLQLAGGALGAAGLIWLYDMYGPTLLARYRPQPRISAGPSMLGAEMRQASTRRRLNSVSAEYRRVAALVQAAREGGHDVAALEQRLARVETLARQGRFDQARMYLNIIELRLPRARELIRPAVQEDATELFPDIDKREPQGRRRRDR